jgi:hypothetical protein
MKVFFVCVIAASLTGCASKLLVYDAKATPAVGVPFNAPKLVRVKKTTSYELLKGLAADNVKYCTDEVEISLDFLPLGERFYVNFDPSTFADGEFAIEFNDKGLTSKISLNSKASTGVDKVSGLLSTVLPFVKAPVALPAAQAAESARTLTTAARDTPKLRPAADIKAEYCLKGKTVSEIILE